VEAIMKEILSISLALILLTFNLVPFFVAFAILFPARMAKTQANAMHMPGRSFGVGVINFVFLLTLGVILFSLAEKVDGLLKILLFCPALLIALVLSIALSFGLGSMAGLAGERLVPLRSIWQRLMWGTLLLGSASAVPLVGWFLFLPYIAWVGMGAFIIGLFQKPAL
jgi:hypothetical protein